MKEKFGKTSKNLKILWKWLSWKVFFAFYVFINSWIFKRQWYLGQNFFYLSKNRPKTNLKSFWYQTSKSLKRLQKQLKIRENLGRFFQLNCSNFRLKQFERALKVSIKKEFWETISPKIFKPNSSFCVKAQYSKTLITIFQNFFASINKNFIFAGRIDTRLSFYEF